MNTQQTLRGWLKAEAENWNPPALLLRDVLEIPSAKARATRQWSTRLMLVIAGILLLAALIASAVILGAINDRRLQSIVESPRPDNSFPSVIAVTSPTPSEHPVFQLPAPPTEQPLAAIPVACSSPEPTASPGYLPGQLAYTLESQNLVIADHDGCNPRFVATQAYMPRWYGDELTYVDESRQPSLLMALDPDGSLRTIGSDPWVPYVGEMGSLSPDGKTFAVMRPDRLTIVAPDDSRRDLALPDGYRSWDGSDWSSLSWMPDGSAVVVSACRVPTPCQSSSSKGSETDHGLFLVPIDGSAPALLASTPSDQPAIGATVSPNGSHIAYWTAAPGNTCVPCTGLGVMRSDGTDRKLLVSPADQETVGTYSWSPDSSQIAYALERDIGFGRGVWVIDADGSSPARQIAPASTQPPMTDEYGNQIGSGGHWIEGWSSDGSAILVRGPFGEPTEGLQSVPLSGDTPTLLVPGAYMGSWQWASGQ